MKRVESRARYIRQIEKVSRTGGEILFLAGRKAQKTSRELNAQAGLVFLRWTVAYP
jgi:hypothetical protein